jgi:hypothetical protein
VTAVTWEPIAIVVALWWATGMTAASILYRRGHDGWHWMFICAAAGPLAGLIVADQARFVEPQSASLTLTRAHSVGDTVGDGVTVVVPAAALGHVDAEAVASLTTPVARVVVVASAAYEHITAGSHRGEVTAANALDDARSRLGPLPVEVVVLPGPFADAVVARAAEHTPAVIVTASDAHHPSVLARMARLVARHPGVGLTVSATAPGSAASAVA